jgi:hypothetical protein
MPSMPARLEVLRTPGKFLADNRPRMPNFDVSKSIDSLKNAISTRYLAGLRAGNTTTQPEAIPEEVLVEAQFNEASVD